MDHDQLSKTILKAFLGEFLTLFQPDVAQQIALETVQFLEQELFTDLPMGEKQLLDVVVKVRTVSGNPAELLIHIEVESGYPTDFPERMFTYYTALRLRHHLLIISIAVYLEKQGEGLWREPYHETVMGKSVVRFEHDAIGLPGLDAERYLATGNPLAFAFAAQMRRGDWSKARLKSECLSRIAHCAVDAARKSLLVNWVQTYLRLSDPEQKEFDALVQASPFAEEVKTMLLTYSGELIQQGIQQGIQQAKRDVLLTLLQTKFGQLPSDISQQVLAIDRIEEVDQLLRQILTATSLEEMGLNHHRNGPRS
jgi:hypothetical protein